MAPYDIKRKVFISFHQKDRKEVDDFIERWADREGVFIPKVLGVSDAEHILRLPSSLPVRLKTRMMQE